MSLSLQLMTYSESSGKLRKALKVPLTCLQMNTLWSNTSRTHTPAQTKAGSLCLYLRSKSLGESRSQAVKRFLSLERSLYSKGQFQKFSTVMEEYFKMNHAELVPVADLQKPPKEIFYLPMHAVRKEHSSTTKLRVVFDASAKSASGISLNDLLLVGPTVHSPLIDVLLRFRLHHVALTADVSKMYRAIELVPSDRDLHRFVWRRTSEEPLQDYCMTRVTFLESPHPPLLQTCLLSRMLSTLLLTTLKLPKLLKILSMLMMASLVQTPYKMPLSCENSHL